MRSPSCAGSRQAVIPPAVVPAGLLNRRKLSCKPEVQQRGSASRSAWSTGLLAPALRIVHVAVVGRDVEVAEHHKVADARRSSAPAIRARLRASELVSNFATAHRFAVHHVQVDDAHVAHGRGEHALLRIVESGDRGDAFAGERQRGSASRRRCRSSARRTRCDSRARRAANREAFVVELGFLQRTDVGLRIAQPAARVRHADVERIDVPAGDLQGGSGNGGSRVASLSEWVGDAYRVGRAARRSVLDGRQRAARRYAATCRTLGRDASTRTSAIAITDISRGAVARLAAIDTRIRCALDRRSPRLSIRYFAAYWCPARQAKDRHGSGGS